MTPQPYDISQALAGRIFDLVRILVGDKPVSQWRGAIRIGTHGSLAVETHGTKTGVWCDHESGTGGDALDLVKHLRCCSMRDAIEWSSSWLGMSNSRGTTQVEHGQRQARLQNSSAPAPTPGIWRSLWTEAQASSGSPVEKYLATRGLHIEPGLPLKFHPACPRGTERLPAMLALMTEPLTGTAVGVHRTYLRPDGSGKADVEPPKMMLGHAGIIRLSHDDDVTIGLGICEGIENALTIMQHFQWHPVWGAGSAGAIAKFPVLQGVENLTIFADHDIAGTNSAQECSKRWRNAGCQSRIIVPRQYGDWNDAVRAVA